MTQLKEYIVSVNNFEDLDSLYDDLETPGGNLYIPDRAVECALRRPVSRNTHYMLTDDEAEQIRQDPRVISVVLTPEQLGIEFRPCWEVTSSKFDKSSSMIRNDYINWGLYRGVLNQQIQNWGDNLVPSVAATVNVTSSGKNVDVIITDGHIDPTHPEFAKNSDGTGGSRVNQFNWFSLNPYVTGGAAGTYIYPPYVDPSYPDVDANGNSQRTLDNNHGCHVAGTACGNTQGWARSANIYNFSPYGTNPNYISSASLFDYIKVFHQRKSINPETGRKNPTITTNSWGSFYANYLSSVSQVVYRGQTYNAPFTASQFNDWGIPTGTGTYGSYFIVPQGYTPIELDIQDMVSMGIIVLGAAGNNAMKISNSSDQDWSNSIRLTAGSTYYFNRGPVPGASSGTICVGAVGTHSNEYKAYYSNCGPRVDIYAPGSQIMSSLNAILTTGIYDSRNDAYSLAKYSGTSMATPQVCGVVACILETYPHFNQTQVLDYLKDYSLYNQLTDGGNSTSYLSPNIDDSSLQGSTNRYLHFRRERPVDGQTFPKQNVAKRPSGGQLYPRPRIYTYGVQN